MRRPPAAHGIDDRAMLSRRVNMQISAGGPNAVLGSGKCNRNDPLGRRFPAGGMQQPARTAPNVLC